MCYMRSISMFRSVCEKIYDIESILYSDLEYITQFTFREFLIESEINDYVNLCKLPRG